jgi:hypothetical protein
MPRNEQMPEARANGRDGTAYTHPAFGQISASRVTGSTTLFGSDFLHQHYVTIKVNRAELNRDLSRDWHFQREEIVEVALSEAQWATFVSSMNVGAGSQCTIQRVQGEQMPSIPVRVQEDEFKEELRSTVAGLTERIDATICQMKEGIGASLSGKKLREAVAEGAVILAMGRLVERELVRRGIPHRPMVHPAARGRIRKRERYVEHVREVLHQS